MTDSNGAGGNAPWSVVQDLYSQVPTSQKLAAFIAVIFLIGALSFEAPAWLSIILLAFFSLAVLWCVVVVVPNNGSQQPIEQKKSFSAFISSQMDSLGDDTKREKQLGTIAELKSALQRAGLVLPSYHAATDRQKQKSFSLPRNALAHNWDALKRSEKFVVIITENGPSSSHMEVGAALALGIPSLWLIKNGVELPFLMREGDKASNQTTLPDIRVERFDELSEIKALIDQHGAAIFS